MATNSLKQTNKPTKKMVIAAETYSEYIWSAIRFVMATFPYCLAFSPCWSFIKHTGAIITSVHRTNMSIYLYISVHVENLCIFEIWNSTQWFPSNRNALHIGSIDGWIGRHGRVYAYFIDIINSTKSKTSDKSGNKKILCTSANSVISRAHLHIRSVYSILSSANWIAESEYRFVSIPSHSNSWHSKIFIYGKPQPRARAPAVSGKIIFNLNYLIRNGPTSILSTVKL